MRDTSLLRLTLSRAWHVRHPRHLRHGAWHPPPGTDIYLVAADERAGVDEIGEAVPVSAAPGYDNQPNFSPDGNRILFAGNRDGKQIDIYVFDRATGRVTQLTQTAENENSPTYRSGWRGVRRQFHRGPVGIRQVGRQAGQPDPAAVALQCRRQVAAIDPRRHQPGGLSRVDDADPLVLFVLGAQGKPATLQIASVKTGKAEVAAENIGRSLHRIPGTAARQLRASRGRGLHGQADRSRVEEDRPLIKAVEAAASATWRGCRTARPS